MSMQLFFVLADMAIQPTPARTLVMGTDDESATPQQLYARAEEACRRQGMLALLVQPVPLRGTLEPRFRAALATWLTWYDDMLGAFADGFTEAPSDTPEERQQELSDAAIAALMDDRSFFIWLAKAAGKRSRRRCEGL
jgi:hypothetical protein